MLGAIASVAFWLALTGSALAQVFPVHTAPDNQWRPTLAYGARPGAYLIVYQHGWPGEIRGILIDQPGKVLANVDVAVGGTQQRERERPDVAYNSKDNQFLVVWQEKQSPDDYDIVGQMIDGQGIPQAGPIPIADTSRTERAPRVAYNGDDNEFLVVWEDGRRLPLEGANEIRGRRIQGAGGTEEQSFKITDYDTEHAAGLSAPAVSYGKGQYLVAWELQKEDRIENEYVALYDVRARHISRACLQTLSVEEVV